MGFVSFTCCLRQSVLHGLVEEERRLTITLKLERMPDMKSDALAATGTKPDLMPGLSGVVALGVEMPIGTQGTAKDDCVTVWF